MPSVRLISREEARQTRQLKTPGIRRQRMNEFDQYARPLVENPEQAVVYEEIAKTPQKFVLSLRGAFARAGISATVRKLRGRDEVRAWVVEPGAAKRAAKGTAKLGGAACDGHERGSRGTSGSAAATRQASEARGIRHHALAITTLGRSWLFDRISSSILPRAHAGWVTWRTADVGEDQGRASPAGDYSAVSDAEVGSRSSSAAPIRNFERESLDRTGRNRPSR